MNQNEEVFKFWGIIKVKMNQNEEVFKLSSIIKVDETKWRGFQAFQIFHNIFFQDQEGDPRETESIYKSLESICLARLLFP